MEKKESDVIKRFLWGSVIVALAIGIMMIGFISSYIKSQTQTFWTLSVAAF